jgi:superkiller protein 3
MLIKARECIKHKDLDQAKVLFKKVVDSDPGTSAAYIGLSRIYLSDGDYEHASKLLDDAINCHDDNAEAWTLKARISIRQDNLEKAIEQYGEALAINPRMNSCRIRMGIFYLRLGHFEKADQILREALRYNPQSISAGILLARTASRRGKADDAIEFIQKLNHRHPTSARVSNLTGRYYMSVNELGEAIAAFNRAIELDAEEPQHFANLGNAHMKKKQPDKAVLAYGRALKLAPNDSRVALNLSRASIDNGDLEAARNLLQELSRGSNRLGQVHMMLAKIHMLKDEYEEAVEEYQAALLQTPKLAESIPDLDKLESRKSDIKAKAEAYASAITEASKRVVSEDSEELDNLSDAAFLEGVLADEDDATAGG